MEEVKNKPCTNKKSMWMTLITFGVYVLFFLFFCIGLVSLNEKAFGVSELIDYVKEPKILFSEMLIDAIKAIFDKEQTLGEALLFDFMKAIFIIYALIVFISFVIKAIFAVISLVRAASGSVEWEKAEETMAKKLKSSTHTLIGFIVCAYLLMSKDFVALEAGAWIFIIVATLYIVGRDAFDDKDLIKTAPVKFILELVYDVAKIVLAIFALKYLLTWPLIQMFVIQIKDILVDFAMKVETADIVKMSILPLVCFCLVYIAVGRCQKSMENNIKGDEAKAKHSAVVSLVFAIIAAVALAIVMVGVFPEERKYEFKDWWEVYGKDFLKIIIFSAIAYAVYHLPKLIDFVNAKISHEAVAVEAETAVSDNVAESAVEAEETVAEDDEE